MVAATKMAVDTTVDAQGMAEEMFGDGMQIISATYTGDAQSSGVYSGGDADSPGTTPSDTGVILSTGSADAYTNADGSGQSNQSAGTTTDTSGVDGDADLDAISGLDTFDGAIFEAKFIPVGDMMTMQFTFSSEEYLEYVDSGFNDVFGVWVNGVQASLAVGTGEVSINDINDVDNSNLYIDNANDQFNTEMDGFTVTLTMKAPLNPGVENTIKIGIADGGDAAYDSNVLIAGDSIQSVTIAEDDAINVGQNSTKNLDVLDNDNSDSGGLEVTHINGVAVSPGQSVVLPTGETVTLNLDGTLQIETDGDLGTNTFTYQVEDDDGNTDIGFVDVTTTVPCFAKGALLETDQGPCAVENIRAGMRIRTRDSGYQPVRWIGRCKTIRSKAHASVVFHARKNQPRLEVSQNHRMVVRSNHAEMLFGTPTVLIPAKDMVNGDTITLNASGGEITYFHLLFDKHQIVLANGRWSESFYPGDHMLSVMAEETRKELIGMFPSLADESPTPFGPMADVILHKHESAALMALIGAD